MWLERFFPVLEDQRVLRRAQFAGEEVMKKAREGMLKLVPEEVFQECFYSWKVRKEKSVRAERECIDCKCFPDT